MVPEVLAKDATFVITFVSYEAQVGGASCRPKNQKIYSCSECTFFFTIPYQIKHFFLTFLRGDP